MRLRSKLVLAAAGVTLAVVAALSILFLGELLRQRIAQTAASNELLAREVLLMARGAVESGLRAHPPANGSDEALQASVADALRGSDSLTGVMNAIVRYSPIVQDVGVTDAHGWTLVSTDPTMWNQFAMSRTSFRRVLGGSVFEQASEMFGPPHVLDISLPLDRNGKPFLVVHLGVRSSFLQHNYAPWLRTAAWVALLASLASVLMAGLVANVALRPIEQIGSQLEGLTASSLVSSTPLEGSAYLALPVPPRTDAVVRVANTIDRLGRQIRSTEEGYIALQTNLDRMLDTLRDGVLLFAADRRAVMVSDAVANFIPDAARPNESFVGRELEEIFPPATALGETLRKAFAEGGQVMGRSVSLEDGRQVEMSLDPIAAPAESGHGGGRMGTLVTLRDRQTAMRVEREMEVSRRLAAIGRLTAGVGHEVKNPINAMVVHLELLKSKLSAGKDMEGAQRHAEVLASEMQRLDRVVQTLADFSRPMDLALRDQDLRAVVARAVELTAYEMAEHGVEVGVEQPSDALCVCVDGEMIGQALLNLMLNAMQAMPDGGLLRLTLRREAQIALIEIADDGEGIPAELMPRIFDLYFTTKPKGSGIGLAMTYRIVQMHGGALEVRSTSDPASPERGSTFTLRLPLSPPQGEELRHPVPDLQGARDE
jgi:signal transduction histidine kinase